MSPLLGSLQLEKVEEGNNLVLRLPLEKLAPTRKGLEEQGTDEILSTVSKSMTADMVLRTTNRIPGHAISTAQPKTYLLPHP